MENTQIRFYGQPVYIDLNLLKAQLGMFTDLPGKMPREEGKRMNKPNMVLLPSKKDPRKRRWQRTDKDQGRTESLFGRYQEQSAVGSRQSKVKKQPWEMTCDEFGSVVQFPIGNRFNIDGEAQEIRIEEEGESRYFTSAKAAQKWIDSKHKSIVKQAIKDGKPVPKSVLADYPELKSKAKKKLAKKGIQKVDLEEFFIETKGSVKFQVADNEQAAGLFGYFQTDEPGIMVATLNSRLFMNGLELVKGGEFQQDAKTYQELTKNIFHSATKSNSPRCVILQKTKEAPTISELNDRFLKIQRKLKGLGLQCVDMLVNKAGSKGIYSCGLNGNVDVKEDEYKPLKKEDIKRTEVKRKAQKFDMNKTKITESKNLAPVFEYMSKSDREKMVVVSLDSKNNVKGVNVAHIGGITESIVDPKMIFRPAVFNKAKSIILLHNHPSLDPTPSREDKLITEKLIQAGKDMGVTVLDHIVVAGKDSYYSMHSEGMFKSLNDALQSHDIRLKKTNMSVADLYKARKLDRKYQFQGMSISIENRKGSIREGEDADGNHWETEMKADYGYIRLTEGTDGDHLDCFVGPHKQAKYAYIIHQNDPVTNIYDEDKVMLGFETAESAKEMFIDHYDRPGFYGSMTILPMEQFKKRIQVKKKPVVFSPKDTKKSILFKANRYLLKVH